MGPPNVLAGVEEGDDVNDASGIAAYLVDNRNSPRGEVNSITFDAAQNDTVASLAASRTIGDLIYTAEKQTGTSSTYFIIGEKHSVRYSTHLDYSVTWFLESASIVAYWLVGVAGRSELGQTTYLAPL